MRQVPVNLGFGVSLEDLDDAALGAWRVNGKRAGDPFLINRRLWQPTAFGCGYRGMIFSQALAVARGTALSRSGWSELMIPRNVSTGIDARCSTRVASSPMMSLTSFFL